MSILTAKEITLRTIRFITWFAIIMAWAVTSFYPEAQGATRALSFVAAAIVEIAWRVKRNQPEDSAITPEPIRSLNLTKRS